jgi:protein involved in polysaccharide export with SLBB domain
MKKAFSSFILISLLSFQILAQDIPLDPNFLSDLPPELTETLLNNAENRDQKIEPFRSPKSAVTKLSTTLSQIQADLDNVKADLDSQSDMSRSQLEIFGKQYFTSFQSSYMPINMASYNPEYIVDYGDKLTIQLVGTINKILDMHVERDGSIMLLSIGKIHVSGLSLERATELIEARVSSTQIGTKAFVSLSAVRDMNIFTIGSVEFPGMYTLSGGSSILQVIDAAGGISDQGSYRNIELIRNNQIIEKIDLYKPLIEGKVVFENQLRSGDVVAVRSRLDTIQVSGAVGYPAIYEFKQGESLKDIVRYAQGLSSSSTNQLLYTSRQTNERNGITSMLAPNDLEGISPQNGDYLFAPLFEPRPNPIRTVTLTGEVVNPGKYSIAPGETLSSVLKRAGGYTEVAYPFGGTLIRENTKKIESKINERIYTDMIKFVASSANAAQVASNESFALILNEFKKAEPIGRVTAEFNISKLTSNQELDLPLEDDDQINIPQYNSEVYVLGEVLNPGARLYKPNSAGRDYINISGGLGTYAEKNKTIVIHPNGDAFLLSDNYLNFISSNVDIYPGTIIYVPREIGRLEGVNYAATIAPIFSSLALSLASLNSIND